jgi:hypothetical protein
MPEEELGLVFGVAPTSTARLRTIEGKFSSLDGALRIGAERSIAVIAEHLEKRIREEFAPHDRTGKVETEPGHVHTINTLKVEVHGLTAEITMGGGAVYVEFGSAPHVIEAKKGGALHWMEGGEDRYQEIVHHPGYVGDPFMRRALEDTDFHADMKRIVSESMSEVWGYAEDKFGHQYTQGQQMRA